MLASFPAYCHRQKPLPSCCFFFFNDTATTEIYTLSLHDALPIFVCANARAGSGRKNCSVAVAADGGTTGMRGKRSEEHTSELQSRLHLVCRLLLEKKKNTHTVTLSTISIEQPIHRAR